MPLTPDQTTLVKASIPALEQHGLAVTKVFYRNMLSEHPELKTIFNEANQVHLDQPRALANAVLAYAKNIDHLSALGDTVELIAAKHASLYVQPEQYPIVGSHLLGALKEVLGDAFTPELHDAWAAAYQQLADILIKREAEIYAGAEGWTDWRDFRIARKVKETEAITSFYLEPVDGQPLPKYLPGQFISVQLPVPSLPYAQSRQYSLSDAPSPSHSHYRISVKRHEGGTVSSCPHAPGLVSNALHAQPEGARLRVSHPTGPFFLAPPPPPTAPQAPVVLISGGVGQTAVTAMLNAVTAAPTASAPARPVTWVHAAHSSAARAFAGEVRALAAREGGNVRVVLFNSVVGADEVCGREYDVEGRMGAGTLLDGGERERALCLAEPDAVYYICGPRQLMLDVKGILVGRGVEEKRVRMELYGTGGV